MLRFNLKYIFPNVSTDIGVKIIENIIDTEIWVPDLFIFTEIVKQTIQYMVDLSSQQNEL